MCHIAQTVEACGAITTKPLLGMPMRDQYGTWGNPEDLAICTDIINKKYKDFAPAWNRSLQSLHAPRHDVHHEA